VCVTTEGNKLLVIDGHSMAFRAFYALPAESFRTTSGQYTNAVHGFTNMLLKLIREEQPTHVALAFDLDTPTFRHQAYEEYKGGRDKTPPEFSGQIDLIKEVAAAMNIPAVTMEGYEADDIVATYVTRASAAGWQTLIVSGDRDALQLVSEHTHLDYPTTGITKTVRLDPAGVEAKYLVPPQKYRDLAGELRRRLVPAALVLVVGLVPEGGGVQVEGQRNMGGLLFADELEQHVREAVHRVGVLAGGGLEALRRQRVERAERHGVAVDHQQLIALSSHPHTLSPSAGPPWISCCA